MSQRLPRVLPASDAERLERARVYAWHRWFRTEPRDRANCLWLALYRGIARVRLAPPGADGGGG